MNEEEIFHEALARNPADRAAYLDGACRGDPALRASVDALLRANVGAGGFLISPARDAAVELKTAAEGPSTAIGPYKLLEQIGEGGFGVVYLAEQTRPVRRKVALKVLKPGMDTRQVVARFEAERQALAVMDHPNIAKVLDGGATAAGRPYFVMELVKGVPITEFCDHNHLTPRQRLELFVSVCQAVQHAHQKGIIHRDLKPSNVLVVMQDATPVPKVIDFGIAKALGQELTDKTLFTGFAQMIGSPLYMSPEQAGQSGLDVDTRSDIYSLGVLLYELLTGTTPVSKERFKEATYDEIRRIIREEEPPRPSTRLSDSKDTRPSVSQRRQTEPTRLTRLVRGELDWIVMKALEKDRNRRYDSANGFAADVHRYLADEPVQACPPSAWYRSRKFARRNRRVLVTAGVVLAALLVAVGSLAFTVAALRDGKADVESALGEKTRALTDLRVEKAKADDALAKEQQAANARTIAVAHLAFLTGDLDQANEALDERPPGQRHWEWYYLKRLCQKGQILHRTGKIRNAQYAITPDGSRFASHSAGTLSVVDAQTQKTVFSLREDKPLTSRLVLSPDGRRLARVGGGSVRIWDLATGKQTHDLTGPTAVTRATFAPGGRLLAWGSQNEVRFTDLETRQDLRSVRPSLPGTTTGVFTPDGNRFLTVNAVGLIEVWDVGGGVRLHQYPEGFASAGFAVSPDGRFYATPRPTGVKVCELDTGRVVHWLPTPNLLMTGGDLFSVAFSADGKRLVHTSADRTVHVWDLTAGHEIRSFPSSQEVWFVGFSEESRRVLTVDASVTVAVRDVDSGPHGLAIRSHPTTADPSARSPVVFTAFSDDGRRAAVAYADGTVSIVGTETGEVVRELPKQRAGRLGGLAFSPDGQWLASCVAGDPDVKVWNVRTGERLASLPVTTTAADGVAFSPDGRRLVVRHTDGEKRLNHIQVWDTSSWREVFTRSFPNPPPGARLGFAYSPDGRQLAVTTTDDRVLLWDTTTGQDERVIREPGCRFRPVRFDPRTGLLAASGDDGAVHVWDAATGEVRNVFRGPSGQPGSVAFSPDGRRMACITLFPNRNPEVRIWDVQSGRSLLALTQPERGAAQIQFSADGHRLLSGSTIDGHLQIWDGSPVEQRGWVVAADVR
jgi:WD40 repeat protein/serine/threonine protein kinase